MTGSFLDRVRAQPPATGTIRLWPLEAIERGREMDRETAITVLQELAADERFAGVLCRVTQYAVGKAPLRTYWVVRVNVLNDRSRRWQYVETPGEWHRLQNETPR